MVSAREHEKKLTNEPEVRNSHARLAWIVGAVVVLLLVLVVLVKPHSDSGMAPEPAPESAKK